MRSIYSAGAGLLQPKFNGLGLEITITYDVQVAKNCANPVNAAL